MTCQHEHEGDPRIEVAESFTIDFCEHGYGQIAFFRAGEERPYAVAYFGPRAVLDMAKTFTDAIVVEGHA